VSALPVAYPFASSNDRHLRRSAGSEPPTAAGTVGRSSSVQRLGARRLDHLKTQLSERDQALLASIGQLRLATSRHLEALHFADAATPLTAARKARRALQRLAILGLTRRLERQIGGLHAGSAGFIYTLTQAGQRLLDQPGARKRVGEPSALFVAHTLALAELFVALTLAARANDGLELLDLQTEPTCWRGWTNLGGGPELLRPDLYLAVGVGADELRWFVELDRGTEHRPALNRKCHAYQDYFESGVEQSRDDVFPRVAWLVPDTTRAAVLADVVAANPRFTPELFAVLLERDAPTALLA
jgi:hypothetical protein